MRQLMVWLSLVLATGVSTSVSASTVVYRTDAELINMAERVVHARVVGRRSAWGGPNHDRIYTVTTLSVIETFKGADDSTLEVWELGGVIDNQVLYVGGAVTYEIGAEVVVCLERGPHGLRSVSMNFSKFDVVSGVGGERRLTRRLAETNVVGGAAPERERTLNEFRETAARVTGRPSRVRQSAQTAQPEVTAEQPFTLLPGVPLRWAQADAGIPIAFYRNTTAPAPLVSGDGTSEMFTALSAWTGPAAASIILQYGGPAFETSARGPWLGISGPAGLVTFEDPENELSAGTLAIGGGFGTSGTGGFVNGVQFDGFTRGFVIFQNAAQLGDEFKQSLGFTRVLTHEIGHAIGLGHTPTDGSVATPTANIMYASCCYPATPIPPSIGSDDLAGLTFIYPVGGSCTYTVGPTGATFPATGGSATISVTTQNGCGWTASSASPFLTVTSGASGTGSGVVAYSVGVNTGPQRSGILDVAGQPVTITQSPVSTTMTVGAASLRFAALMSGSTILTQTGTQTVRLTQTGQGLVSWTALPTQPWLHVSPSSGSGTADLSISVGGVGGMPSSGALSGSVVLTYSGAATLGESIAVTLTLIPATWAEPPFGYIDTPVDGATGVTGAIPMTGWALDDIEVVGVTICRNAVEGEPVAADGRCGGAVQIFVGDAVFIEGTRPDVQTAYPNYPRNSRAGWGFMVLTNTLPNQGNGSFVFTAYAYDGDGHVGSLGARTITCDNAHATLPFGTIDTPGQGETIAGSSYVNFGWALTQNPKFIPFDGSTIMVYIDGVPQGSPSYNHFRSDIAGIFPGLANSNGAVGYKVFDTTTLANGLHTIVWTATDSDGFTGGLGSRYFRVANGTAASTAASESAATAAISAASISATPLDTSPIVLRHGWNPEASWRAVGVGASGRAVVRGEEIDRFEIALAEHDGERYTGYLRVGSTLGALPIGSQLDARTGAFTWSPGVGFVGSYDFVFVRWAADRPVARQEVRVILQPKGSGHVGPQIRIDTPRAQQDVPQPFLLGGWAADLDAEFGTGIDTLHVWAYPLTGGPPIFLGVATYGGVRPDVAAVHGDRYRLSGFGLTVQGLVPGNYDIAVFPWSNVSGGFAPAGVVRITVR